MTAKTEHAGSQSMTGLIATLTPDEQGQLYKSAVRFTRLYATFSPTMVALLMAKKTRFGRYIPLPDALPDGFRPGGIGSKKTQPQGDAGTASGNGPAAVQRSTLEARQPAGQAHAPVRASSTPQTARPADLASTPARAGGAGPKPVDKRLVEYEVVHEVPGRVRISIPLLARDKVFAQRLADGVMALPAVSRARVSPHSRSLVVEYRHYALGSQPKDPILPHVVECIRVAAGADAAWNLAVEKPKPAPAAEPKTTEERTRLLRPLTLPALSLGLSAGMVAGLSVPAWLMGGLVLVAARPIFGRAWQGIRDEKRLTVEFLDATTIALMVSQASFLAPSIITGVIESSEVARNWTARRSKQASLELQMSLEHTVYVERAGMSAQATWDEIQPGDVIQLYPGDQIPVDGRVLEGRALVDQQRITGTSLPVVSEAGDTVPATALLIDGHLRVLAQQTGHATRLGETVTLMKAAPSTDTRVSNWARRTGNWAVLPTLLIGGAVYAASGSVARATGIVNLDLGTGMRVSSPIAVLTAQYRAARRGILIRSGRGLEMLAAVDLVVFDKTATLTGGRAAVVHVQPHRGAAQARDVLALAASAEQAMRHPIGEAIVRHARQMDIDQQPVSSWDYLPGLGVVAGIDGQVVRVGNSQLMADAGIDVAGFSANGFSDRLATATQVYVSRSDDLVGAIYCSDPLRPESAGVIHRLQTSGVDTLILSGDGQPVVEHTALSLGVRLESAHGDLTPQAKVEIVQRLRADGRRVAVVGDGVNDAAAMAHADVGVALGSASALARETADIVLANDDLSDLLVAMQIARHAVRVMDQNRVLVTVPNIAGIAYGVVTVVNPVAPMLINNGSAVLAALNSLRPAKAWR